MVLRNARRFDEVNARLAAAEQGFEASFNEALNRICDDISAPGDPDLRVRVLAASQKYSFRGLRVTLVPHQRLAIERLERLDGALLSSASVKWLCQPPRSYTLFIPFEHQGRPILGGVEYINFESRIALRRHRVQRDGIVELSEMSRLSGAEKSVPVEWLVRATASVLAIYDRLRDWAGAPSMPAEISVEILGLVGLKPQIGEWPNEQVGTCLGFRTLFDRCTVADPTDFDDCLNMLARDLLNAGGLSTARVPQFTMAVA